MLSIKYSVTVLLIFFQLQGGCLFLILKIPGCFCQPQKKRLSGTCRNSDRGVSLSGLALRCWGPSGGSTEERGGAAGITPASMGAAASIGLAEVRHSHKILLE